MSRHFIISLLVLGFVIADLPRVGRVNAQSSCPTNPPWFDCSRSSVSFTPLNQMTSPQTYTGQIYAPGTVFEGGLYGNYQNSPPATHFSQALAKASQIQPLNASGQPDPAGVIGLMSIGMSNTQQEFAPFIELAEADPSVSPRLVVINGARGGRTASAWAYYTETTNPWDSIPFPDGVTPAQVQVLWIKLSDFPPNFPEMKTNIEHILNVRLLEHGYTNVKLIYFSSRIYGGYTLCSLNPEPFAYESAFPVQELILEQIENQDYSASKPVLLWGPYLWANGTTTNPATNLNWTCHPDINNSLMDFQEDGTHPSAFGEAKVAQTLLNFFKSDTFSTSWFTANGSPGPTNTPTPTSSHQPTPTLEPVPSATPSPLEGDINLDNHVNGLDYAIFFDQWDQPVPPGDARCDFNQDAVINSLDYLVLYQNWEAL